MNPITACCIWLIAIAVIFFILVKSRSSNRFVVDKEGEEAFAVEFLVSVGFTRRDAIERVNIAVSEKPDGDANDIINIAIKL